MTNQRDRKRRRISARKQMENREKGFEGATINLPEGFKFFSVKKKGVKRIDVIPFRAGKGNPECKEGELHYERTFYRHNNIGIDGKNYICLLQNFGNPCPICEEYDRVRRDPDSNKEEVNVLKPKQRQLWNVIDLGDPDEGVQVWDISYYWFGEVLYTAMEFSDEDEEVEFFADTKGGKTLKIGIQEGSFAGRANYRPVTVEFKERKEDYPDTIIDKACCLDSYFVVHEYDELRAILNGMEGDSSEEAEPEDQKEEDPSSAVEEFDLSKGDEVTYQGDVYTISAVSKDGSLLKLTGDGGNVPTPIGVALVQKFQEDNGIFEEKEEDDKEDKDEDRWDDFD